MDVKTLIEEVLIDLGNNKSLTEVSSKIQIIVRLLGDDDLKKWYQAEFVSGYKDQDLPEYRISQAADIKADYLRPQGFGVWKVSGQSVPVANLGSEKYGEIMTVRMTDTISSIIEYAKHPDHIAMSLSPYECRLIQQVLGYAQIQSVHKELSPSTFQTIIDSVQGKIIEMFMDIDEKVFNGGLDIKSDRGKKEMHQVITNNITAGIYQSGNGVIDASGSTIAAQIDNALSHEATEQLRQLADNIESVAKDTDKEFGEIAQDIVDIRDELNSRNPNRGFLKKSFKALSWGASVSCRTAIEELVKKAIELLNVGD